MNVNDWFLVLCVVCGQVRHGGERVLAGEAHGGVAEDGRALLVVPHSQHDRLLSCPVAEKLLLNSQDPDQ